MSTHIHHVTDETFEDEVIRSDLPVLVDFYAQWCGPCKQIAPILETVAEQYKDTLRVRKVDVDVSIATATKYGIRGVPTLIVFQNGEVAATQVGAVTQSQLTKIIDDLLSAN